MKYKSILFLTILCLTIQNGFGVKFKFRKSHGRSKLDPFLELSGEEFEFKLVTAIFNGIMYEPTSTVGENGLGAFENSLESDKMFRCLMSRNMQFATKLFYHAVLVKLKNYESKIDQTDFPSYESTALARTLRKRVNELIAYGNNIFCHREIIGVEKRIDANAEQLFINVKEIKEQLLEIVIKKTIQIFRLYLETKIEHSSHEEIEEFEKKVFEANQHWTLHLKLPSSKLQALVDEIRPLAFNVKYAKLWAEVITSYVNLKFATMALTPLLTIKKLSLRLYELLGFLLNSSNLQFRNELGGTDINYKFRNYDHYTKTLLSIFLASHTWFLFFQNPNTAGPVRESEEFYFLAGEANKNYKACSILAEFREIFVFIQKEFALLASLPFYPSKRSFKEAIQSVYQRICINEAQMCLESLLAHKNYRSVSRVIQKLEPTFFEKLSYLRKLGPYSDIGISRNNKEEVYYIKMGYMASFQNSDRSLMIWQCRFCGGDYVMTNIKFQRGSLEDFIHFRGDPSKSFTLIQIFADVVMIIEKVLLSGEVLGPHSENLSMYSSIIWEKPKSTVFTGQGYEDTKTGFFLLKNLFSTVDYDWVTHDFPMIFNPNGKPDLKSYNILTQGDDNCNANLLEHFHHQINYEDNFDDFIMWSYVPKPDEKPEDMISKIQEVGCIFINYFETKPNSVFVLIDLNNLELINQKRDNNDPRSMSLIIERVPQQPLYLAYTWTYPFDEERRNILKWEDVTIKDIQRDIFMQRIQIDDSITNALCSKGTKACSFLDTGNEIFFKDFIVGDSMSFPEHSVEFRYSRAVNAGKSDLVCNELFNQIKAPAIMYTSEANMMFKDLYHGELDTTSGLGSIINKLIENDCEFSRVFWVKFICGKSIKYLYFPETIIRELCIEETEKPKSFDVPLDSRFAVEKDYYIYLKASKVPLNFKLSLEDIHLYGYHVPAEWIHFPVIHKVNSEGQAFYISLKVLVRISPVSHSFIGLPDYYSNEECVADYGHWNRFIKESKSGYSPELFHYRFERSLFYSLKPQILQLYKSHFGIGILEKEKWATLITGINCENLRIFLPIQWKGDESMSCNVEHSVRSLKYVSNKGLIETCDGDKLPISEVYYLEILAYTDTNLPEFTAPLDNELLIARKNGYIPLNSLDTFNYNVNGLCTKMRIWVKPDVRVQNYKRILCNTLNDIEPEEFRESEEEDIYTRLVIENLDELKIE